MNKRSVLFISLVTLILISFTNSKPIPIEEGKDDHGKSPQHFSYNEKDENGPSNWPGFCKAGKRQSPIIYDKKRFKRIRSRPTLIMSGGYKNKPEKVHLFNSGHGIVVSFKYKNISQPKITGGPLRNETYVFASFHYHTPCEHQFHFNPQFCVLEIHMVHYNEKYGSIENSIDKEDGLAVIGIMYLTSNGRYLRNLPFVPLIKNVLKPNADYFEVDQNKMFSYHDMLGSMNVPRIVTYKGSLTTPDCSESVTWLLFAAPHLVLGTDMRQIREVQDSKGAALLKNNRPVQPLNGREIYLFSAF